MSGAGFFLLLFGVCSCQVGLCGIRYRALPNWVPVSHVWGLSLLAEIFLEPGRQACNSWVFGHSILLSFCDSPQYALGPAYAFLLGDPGLGEEPLRCVRCLQIQSLATSIRPRQELLLRCQRLERMRSLELMTCV